MAEQQVDPNSVPVDEQEAKPDPGSKDPEIVAAEKAKAIADAKKAVANAEQAATEAEAAVATAKRTAANADRDAALADDKAKAENEKAIAEAKSTALKAWLPEPKSSPLEGTVEVGAGTGAIGRVAAMSLLGGAADHIAKGVVDAKPKRVLIVDELDLAAGDWAHALVNSQVERLAVVARKVRTSLDAAAPLEGRSGSSTRSVAALGAAATVIPSLVGAAADVAGYFRSNYKVDKVDVTKTTTPLIAAVAAKLIGEGITCYVDALALFHDQVGTLAAFSKLMDARWDLLDSRLRASQVTLARSKEEVTKAQALLDENKTAKPEDAEAVAKARAALTDAQDQVAHVQGVIDAAAKVEELIDTLSNTLTTVATGATLPPLGQAALRDLIHDRRTPVHVLALSVDEIGSDAITRRQLFRAPKITYVGATNVSALLLAPGGAVTMATTHAATRTTHLPLPSGNVDIASAGSMSTVAGPAGATPADPMRPPFDAIAAPLPPIRPKNPEPARWTLMVFMAGMNNLAAEADTDIAEILAGEPGGDIEVVVFVKQPTGSRRFRALGEVEDLGDHLDSGDPNTVVDFVRWAAEVAPAEHYALVLWNHGSGWEPWTYDIDAPVAVRPAFTAAGNVLKVNSSIFPRALVEKVEDRHERQRAILTDDGTSHAVDTIELEGITKAVVPILGKKLDVLAMDACLMSNLEVVSQVRDEVEVVIGSEELEPGTGWHYTDLLGKLRAAGPGLDAAGFGRLAVDSYIDGYEGSGEPVTMCAVGTANISALVQAVDGLGAALFGILPDGRGLVTQLIGDSTRFDGHLVDLGHLCKNIVAARPAENDPLASAAQAVQALLAPGGSCVLAERHDGPGLDYVQGVTIYMPASTDPYAPTYDGIRLSKETRWDEFLREYVARPG